MTERAPRSPEHSSEQGHERHKRNEALRDTAEQGKKARHEHADNIESIRKSAEAAATSSQDLLKNKETGPDTQERPSFVNRELKNMAYQRTLKRTQRQLSAPSRALSRFVHQPTIEAVSDVASSTVARPSGVLAGGIAAFLGSSLFLWIARHYGYEYNFLLFALLFVGGFFIGLIIELVWRAAIRRNH